MTKWAIECSASGTYSLISKISSLDKNVWVALTEFSHTFNSSLISYWLRSLRAISFMAYSLLYCNYGKFVVGKYVSTCYEAAL